MGQGTFVSPSSRSEKGHLGAAAAGPGTSGPEGLLPAGQLRTQVVKGWAWVVWGRGGGACVLRSSVRKWLRSRVPVQIPACHSPAV